MENKIKGYLYDISVLQFNKLRLHLLNEDGERFSYDTINSVEDKIYIKIDEELNNQKENWILNRFPIQLRKKSCLPSSVKITVNIVDKFPMFYCKFDTDTHERLTEKYVEVIVDSGKMYQDVKSFDYITCEYLRFIDEKHFNSIDNFMKNFNISYGGWIEIDNLNDTENFTQFECETKPRNVKVDSYDLETHCLKSNVGFPNAVRD